MKSWFRKRIFIGNSRFLLLQQVKKKNWDKETGCHSGTILKNNMRGKDFKRDKRLTAIRMPFEGTFSKIQKRARYRGTMKVQYQEFMQALAHNVKKLILNLLKTLDLADLEWKNLKNQTML